MTLTQSKIKSTPWLEKFGQSTINNGYLIHPIPQLSKGIFEDGWQKVRADGELLAQWLEQGRGGQGISLLSGFGYIGVDIDSSDPKVVDAIIEHCRVHFGKPLIRIGNKPKSLLVYRCDERLSKMRSATFECWEGEKHAVEILAVGQQFVAYNIHPKTKEPYRWVNGNAPHNVALKDIEGEVNHDDLVSLLSFCEGLFAQAGMEPVKGRGGMRGRILDKDAYEGDEDAEFLAALSPRLNLSRDQIVAALKATRAYAVDYDTWLAVGMALHHQSDGSEKGLELWDKWSQHPEANYDAKVCREKWQSFKGRAQYGQHERTFRYVLQLAEESLERKRRDNAAEVLPELKEIASHVTDDHHLTTEVLPTLEQRIEEVDANSRVLILNTVAAAVKAAGIPMKLGDIRRALGINVDGELTGRRGSVHVIQSKRDEIRAEHPWTEGIYWVIDRDMFASADFGMISLTSARAIFGRNLLDISEDKRESYVPQPRLAPRVDDPVWFLHNVIQVPHVHAVSYVPGGQGIIENPDDGSILLNSFRPWFVRDSDGNVTFLKPVSLEHEWSPKQKQAVERFKRLILSVSGGVGHEREAAVLTSWVAARFQNPRRKNQWSPFLWGPKGSGKSSFGNALQAIFTHQHCIMVSTSEIVSSFSGYAGQACIAIVDEADLSGHRNREDVATRLRPHITSSRVVRLEKGRDGRNVPNYQDYIFMGNRADGLPIDEGERRFLVLSSEFQTREEARAVMVGKGVGEAIGRDLEDPECVAALRGYLFEYELHSEYNHGDPIDTEAKRMSTEASRSALADELLDMVEDDRCWFATREFVSITHVRNEIRKRIDAGLSLDIDPRTNRNVFGQVLGNEPFNMLTTARVECDGEKYSLRVRNAAKFDKEEFKFLVRRARKQQEEPDDFR